MNNKRKHKKQDKLIEQLQENQDRMVQATEYAQRQIIEPPLPPQTPTPTQFLKQITECVTLKKTLEMV